MIKVIKTLLLTTFAFFVVINPSYALDTSPSPKASLTTQKFIQERADRKERLREDIEAHKEEMATKKEQVRERTEAKIASHEAVLSEARKTRTREFYGRLYTRFMAAIKRLEILTARIDSRLASIKEENPDVDTSEVEEKIAEAKSLLLDAQMDLDAVNANFDEVLESDDPNACLLYTSPSPRDRS